MKKLALVVDDSRVARMTLRKLLTQHQFDVVELPSAEDTLDYLKSESPRPDVIFMDVLMLGMDGFVATKMIKELPSMQNMPVIICTGSDENNDNRADNVGAMAVLTKPPIEDDLAKVMAKLDVESQSIEDNEQNIDEKDNVVDEIVMVESEPSIEDDLAKVMAKLDVESQSIEDNEPYIDEKDNVVDEIVTVESGPSIDDEFANAMAQLESESHSVNSSLLFTDESVTDESSTEDDLANVMAKLEEGAQWDEDDEPDTDEKGNVADEAVITTLTELSIEDELASVMAKLDEGTQWIEDDDIADVVVNKSIITTPSEPSIEGDKQVEVEHITERVQSIDNTQLVTQIITDIESSLVPKIHQEVKEIATEVTEKLASEVSLKVAQESVADMATTAVQAILNEADITTQVSSFLAEKGEEWLEEQEEDLGIQLTTQMELLIPGIVSNSLGGQLEVLMTPFIEREFGNYIARDELGNIIEEHLHKYPEVEGKSSIETVSTEYAVKQEEDLGTQITAQIESLAPGIVSNYLDSHLEGLVAPLLTNLLALERDRVREDTENMIDKHLKKYTETEIEPVIETMLVEKIIDQEPHEQDDEVESLGQQVETIKKITIGLAIVVSIIGGLVLVL